MRKCRKKECIKITRVVEILLQFSTYGTGTDCAHAFYATVVLLKSELSLASSDCLKVNLEMQMKLVSMVLLTKTYLRVKYYSTKRKAIQNSNI